MKIKENIKNRYDKRTSQDSAKELRKIDRFLALSPSRRILTLLIFVLLIIGGGSIYGATDLFNQNQTPPIILVSVDTFRADRVSAAGYERNITPNLDSFIENAYYFENSYANAPWTLPSHSSLMTGKYPSETGVLNLSYKVCENEDTLAERLSENGYSTAGFTGDGPVSKYFGFDQGFDRWNETEMELRKGNIPKSINFIQESEDDNVFIFAHGWDVHAPYVVPKGPPAYGNNFSDSMTVTDKDIQKLRENNRSWIPIRRKLDTKKGEPELQQLVDLYDSSAIPMDKSLGRMFDALKKKGIYDDALIIVVSDHGEEFREHGRIGHSQMYRETIQVLTAVKLPGQKDGVHVKEPVELRDVYPTVLQEAGLQTEHGIPLQDVAQGEESRNYVFSEREQKKMVVKDGYKLIWNFGYPNEKEYKLYNLQKDPYEQNDLSNNKTLLKRLNKSFKKFPDRVDERCAAEIEFQSPQY